MVKHLNNSFAFGFFNLHRKTYESLVNKGKSVKLEILKS